MRLVGVLIGPRMRTLHRSQKHHYTYMICPAGWTEHNLARSFCDLKRHLGSLLDSSCYGCQQRVANCCPNTYSLICWILLKDIFHPPRSIFQHPPSFLRPRSSEDGTTWNEAAESRCCRLVILLSASVALHRLHCPRMPQPPATRLVSQRKDSEEEAILQYDWPPSSDWYVPAGSQWHYESSLPHSELLKAQIQPEGAVSLLLLAFPRISYVRRSEHGNLSSRGRKYTLKPYTNHSIWPRQKTMGFVEKTTLDQSTGEFY